ncbi:ankyrin repeat-containing domain protein [Russula dissimulans]|nr:ankyrin repeat-containing domain protein [Russula dissimulans]
MWTQGITEGLIAIHGQDVVSNYGYHGTPLHAASFKGHVDIVRVLLNHGADHGASMDGLDGLQILQAATSDGPIEAVRLLLQYNFDVDIADGAGWTALHWVTSHPKVIELLLEYGANVNPRTVTNSTPLWMASEDGVLESVQTLLTHGADVHIRGEKNLTPLQVATSRGHREIAELLLKHGAIAE